MKALRSANAAWLIAVAFLAILKFFPILQTGLTGADAYLQYIGSVTGFDGVAPLKAYDELVAHYRTSQPGFFPLTRLPLALWLANPPRIVVKALQLVLVGGTFATFSVVARYLFNSRVCSLMATVIALAIWQLRTPHDPVIGTSFVMPLIAEWLLIAYGARLVFLSSGRRIWLVISCVAIIAGMLSDPLGWAFGGLLAVQALFDFQRRRERFAPAAAFLLGVGVSIPFGLPRLPWSRPESYGSDILSQILAPVPTSFRAIGHLPIGRTPAFWHLVDDRFINIPAVHFSGWLLISGFTAIAFATLRALSTMAASKSSLRDAIFFGVAFWLIPALVLGPQATFYKNVPIGQAFDVVYVQYFGVASLVTAGLIRLRAAPVKLAVLSPSLFALTVLWLLYGNMRADAFSIAKSVRSAISRDLIERAGSAGFFDVLPEGSTLAVSPFEPFSNGIHGTVGDAKYAIYAFSKRRFRVIDADKLGTNMAQHTWILRTSPTSGIFVELDHWAGRKLKYEQTDRAYGYSAFPTVRSALTGPQRSMLVTLTSLGDGFKIAVRRRCGPVPLNLAFVDQTPDLKFESGFYGYSSAYGSSRPGTYAGQPFFPIYMERDASLVIRPTTCAAAPLKLHGMVVSNAPSTLLAIFPKYRQRFNLQAGLQSFDLTTPATRSPVELHLKSDVATNPFSPPNFRYERDRPDKVGLSFTNLSVSDLPFIGSRHDNH